jgi:hypothetical protein
MSPVANARWNCAWPAGLDSSPEHRIGRPVVPPDLSTSGYRLMGGRVIDAAGTGRDVRGRRGPAPDGVGLSNPSGPISPGLAGHIA